MISALQRGQLHKASGWRSILLGAAALIIGLALGRLPLLWAAILLLSAILIVLTVIDPLIGVGMALVLGPTKPLTDYFVPDLPLDLGQIALLVVLGAWFLHAAHRHVTRIPNSPFVLPLLLFLGAALLSAVDALSIGFALKEMLKWIQLLMIMWLVIDLAGARRWRIVVAAALIAGAVQALIGVWQFGIRGDGPEHFLILGDRFYRAYGTFEQPNPYGGFIGLMLPIAIALTLGALDQWVRPIFAGWQTERVRGVAQALINPALLWLAGFGALTGLLGAALIMSWSRGAWVGFGAAALAILFAWPRKARIGAALIIGALVCGIIALRFGLLPSAIADRLTGFAEDFQTFDVRGVDITPENYAVMERLAHWQAAQSMAQYHFWVGVGIGNYEPVYPVYALLNWPFPLGHAHNIYLNTLAEMGIIGLITSGIVGGDFLYHMASNAQH